MICGLKWKSCNCPWFNYDAVEADRLNHEADRLNDMRVPEDPEEAEPRPHRLRRPRPDNYNDEMNQRRRQERADEELARRLERMDVDDDDDGYQGGVGNIQGIGNGAGHFMNQNYIRAAHNILTGNFDQATAAANYVMGVAQARGPPRPPPGPLQPGPRRYPPPPAPGNWNSPPRPPPVLRRHTMREQVYNSAQSTPSAERVVPRRTRTDYASEAAVHAPLGASPQRQRAPSTGELRPSVLAGLGGRGRYANRVGAWRTHVEPIAPEEGVLSMP